MLEIQYIKYFEQGKEQSFCRISLNHSPKPVAQFQWELLSRQTYFGEPQHYPFSSYLRWPGQVSCTQKALFCPPHWQFTEWKAGLHYCHQDSEILALVDITDVEILACWLVDMKICSKVKYLALSIKNNIWKIFALIQHLALARVF